MTDRQENVLTMSKTVQTLLTNNASIVALIAAFVTNKTALDNEISTIDGVVQIQVKNIKGTTEDKKAAKNAGIDKGLELCGATKSYAGDTDNNTLLESVNYSKSDLDKLRDTTLTDTLTLIRDTVQANIAALADYGVLPADVSAFTTLIATYSTLVSAPRGAINLRVAATKALETEFPKLKKILERLDGFVDRLKSSHADFYNAYYSARVIVDTGAKKKEEPTP